MIDKMWSNIKQELWMTSLYGVFNSGAWCRCARRSSCQRPSWHLRNMGKGAAGRCCARSLPFSTRKRKALTVLSCRTNLSNGGTGTCNFMSLSWSRLRKPCRISWQILPRQKPACQAGTPVRFSMLQQKASLDTSKNEFRHKTGSGTTSGRNVLHHFRQSLLESVDYQNSHTCSLIKESPRAPPMEKFL